MTLVIKDKGLRQLEFDPKRLENKLLTYTKGLRVHPETVDKYIKSVINQISAQEKVDFRDINNAAILNAVDFIMSFNTGDGVDFEKLGNTDFEYVAARVLLNSLYKRASKNRSYDAADKYGDYYGLLVSWGRWIN